MIKLKSLKEYEDMKNYNEIPPIIANAVIGDLLMMKEYIDDDFYNKDEVDKYGPFVAVMTREEFQNLEEIIPSITKDEYEYKDIVGVDDNGYITKILYLFNNGESGIIIYVVSYFEKCKQKFAGKTYMTRGFKDKISNTLLGYLVKLMDISRLELNDNLDYLQVFDIKPIGSETEPIAMIHHKQECPGYSKVIYIPGLKCEKCKLFWVSSYDEEGNEYSTLMFAEEY